MIEVKMRSYYVGLGSANVIEVSVDQSPNEYILIDFGSAGGGKLAVHSAFDRIRQINNGKFRALFFTHLDIDHINKATALIEGGYLTSAEKVYIGGTDSGMNRVPDTPVLDSSGKKNCISRGARLMRALLDKHVCGEADIVFLKDTGYHVPLITWAGAGGETFCLKLLASRSCLSPKGPPKSPRYINSNSSVIVAEYAVGEETAGVCFSGDATFYTFNYILQQVTEAKRKVPPDLRYDSLENAKKNVLILPHHAALNTACRGGKISMRTPVKTQLNALSGIAELIHPDCVYASAHYVKYGWHPCRNMIDIFETVEKAAPSHKVLAFLCQTDAEGRPLAYLPRDLICDDEDRHIYTSHAYDRNFIIKSAILKMDGSKPNYFNGGEDITSYGNLCYELICEMNSGLPEGIRYSVELV